MARGIGLFLLAVGILAAVIGGIGTVFAIGELNRGGAGALLIFAAIDLFALGLLIAAVVILRRAKPIGTFTTTGGGPPGHYPPDVGVVHDLDNTSYTVRYTAPVKGKNSQPSVLTISTTAPCDGEFQMVVESWFDKMCKRWGIAAEVQTGDDKFDDECYVRSDTPEFTAAYLADPVKRIAILDLRRFGFREVTLGGGKISANWTGFNPATDHRDDLPADVAARLILLVRNLPEPQPGFSHRTGSRRRMWQLLLWLLLAVFGLSAISLIAFPPVETTDLLLRAVPVGLLGWPVFAFLSAFLLSGSSRSHLAWSGLLIGSLFLVPMGSVGSVGLLNGVLDSSPAATHDAVVAEKYTTRSKNKTKYHVRVASWRNPGQTISFQINGSEYGAVTPGRSKLVVTTHGGWLAVEWLKSKHLQN